MARFRREARRWNRIYSPLGPHLPRLWDRLTRSNVRKRFQRTFEVASDLRDKAVLDLGCGTGQYLVEALDRGARRVVGIDFAEEMIGISRQNTAAHPRASSLELRCEDLRNSEFRESFDLVVANGLFDYLTNPQPVLSKMAGWCHGTVVASFPDKWSLRALPRTLYWRRRGIRIHLFTRNDVTNLAETAELSHVHIERIGPIFLLVAHRSPSGTSSRTLATD
jgi:SAM-dependent methyltransferase